MPATTILPVHVRPAAVEDLSAVNDIYNYFVARSTCTYQEEPETMRDRHAWFEAHGPAHPVTVAVQAGEVVGWAALSPYHRRSAYRHTVENSLYVAPAHHGRGIGQTLLAVLIDRARVIGHHSIVAAIDADQAASIVLHAKLGFREVGRMRELGLKFGRWLDVVYLQLML